MAEKKDRKKSRDGFLKEGFFKEGFFRRLIHKEEERNEIAEKLEQRYRAQGEYDPDLDRRHPEATSFLLSFPMAVLASVWFVLKHVANLLFAVFYLVYALFFSSFSYALGTVIVVTMIFGGWYLYTNRSLTLPTGGINLEGVSEITGSGTLENIFSQPGMEAYYIPREIEPIMDVEQSGIVLERYRYLITSGQIGNHGEGAVTLLKNALGSKNPVLRSAAYEALIRIGNREAKQAIERAGGSLK